jgi:RND family efflux transporter MFP subunit
MRWVFIALIYGGSAVALVALWNSRQAANQRAPQNSENSTPVRKRPASRIFADGIVEGSQPEAVVRFEIAGRISTIYVQENDTVAAGDVIAELDAEAAELRLADARTRLTLATAERDVVLAEIKLAARERRVQQTGGERPAADATSTKADKARETAAEARVTVAQDAIRHEELLLEKTRLRAPFDGVVLRAAPDPGEFTGPTDERELFVIANRSTTRVRAFVEELDALRVAPGLRAVVTSTADPDREYPGKIVSCAPSVRPKMNRQLKPGERLDVRVREVLIELDDGADLLLGLPVEVFIERPQRRS